MNGQDDEFYIGYETAVPPGMRRMVAGAVTAAILVALFSATMFVSRQRALAQSRFEFGQRRTFAGYLAVTPAPVLYVAAGSGFQPHWLVARGKFGPGAALGDVKAGWVTLLGTLIEREQWRMIEVVSGSVRAVESSMPAPLTTVTAAVPATLSGEIVDSKCFLGVMNPGERTVHRDCAMRCLDGGIPVMFAFEEQSRPRLALLLGADAETLRRGVGRNTTLSGTLSGSEEALVFTLAHPGGDGHR